MKRCIILFLIFLVSCKNTKDNPGIIAKINNKTIAQKTIDSLITLNIYTLRKNMVIQTIDKYILTEEAKKKKAGINDLLIGIVGQNTNRFMQGDSLQKKKVKMYLDSLKRTEYKVSFMLESPYPKLKSNKLTEYYIGDPKSSVSLCFVSDFDCAHCKELIPVFKHYFNRRYHGKIKISAINFSLSDTISSIACEAAGLQGKYWEMYDMIFQNYITNNDSIFLNYAKRLNLNLKEYIKDFTSKKLKNKISNRYKFLLNNGIQYVPTYILNDNILPVSTSFDELDKLVEEYFLYEFL